MATLIITVYIKIKMQAVIRFFSLQNLTRNRSIKKFLLYTIKKQYILENECLFGVPILMKAVKAWKCVLSQLVMAVFYIRDTSLVLIYDKSNKLRWYINRIKIIITNNDYLKTR